MNWNGKKVLNDCLKSILTSSYKNYKITVIDNGSSDGSLKDLNKISNKINIIKIDKNLGYSKGDFPLAEYVSSHTLSLPVQEFITDDQCLFMASTVRDFYKGT